MDTKALINILDNIGCDHEDKRSNPCTVTLSAIKDYGPVVLVESEGGEPSGYVWRNEKWVELPLEE
jgi:hypothetical protein